MYLRDTGKNLGSDWNSDSGQDSRFQASFSSGEGSTRELLHWELDEEEFLISGKEYLTPVLAPAACLTQSSSPDWTSLYPAPSFENGSFQEETWWQIQDTDLESASNWEPDEINPSIEHSSDTLQESRSGLPLLPAVGLISLLMGASTAHAVNLVSSDLNFSPASDNTSQSATITHPPQGNSTANAPSNSSSTNITSDSIALNFELDAPPVNHTPSPVIPPNIPKPTVSQNAAPEATKQVPLPSIRPDLEQLFQGGPTSLIAKAVGSAEGTRTADGGKTWAYYGHKDPGNGVWNLGSFSYQHGAKSPAEADRKQLKRLAGQAERLRQQAQQLGIQMSLLEEVNGIDLANQSPRAALSEGGYVDRLQQAHQRGLRGADAVIWARTRSYLNPKTGRWQAPGLGNTERSITADQERRFRAIEEALLAHQQLTEAVAAQPLTPPPTSSAIPPNVDSVQPANSSNPVEEQGELVASELPPTASMAIATSPSDDLAQNLPSGRSIASTRIMGKGSIPSWRLSIENPQISEAQGKVQRLLQVLNNIGEPSTSTRVQQVLGGQSPEVKTSEATEVKTSEATEVKTSEATEVKTSEATDSLLNPSSSTPTLQNQREMTSSENTSLPPQDFPETSGPERSSQSQEPEMLINSTQATQFALHPEIAEKIIFQNLSSQANSAQTSHTNMSNAQL